MLEIPLYLGTNISKKKSVIAAGALITKILLTKYFQFFSIFLAAGGKQMAAATAALFSKNQHAFIRNIHKLLFL